MHLDSIVGGHQLLICATCAVGNDWQFKEFGMGLRSPFVSSGNGALDSLGFRSRSANPREHVSFNACLIIPYTYAHIDCSWRGCT